MSALTLETASPYVPRAMSLMEQVRVARQRRRITQRAIGARFGLTQSQVSAIETGQVDPRLSSVLGFAQLLELEPMLIPRALVPAVRALLARQAADRSVDRDPFGSDLDARGIGADPLSCPRKAAP